MANGLRLSNYIFSHQISAKEFDTDASNTLVSYTSGYPTEKSLEELEVRKRLTPFRNETLREKLDFFLKRLEDL